MVAQLPVSMYNALFGNNISGDPLALPDLCDKTVGIWARDPMGVTALWMNPVSRPESSSGARRRL